ncbi:MAG: response regulator [Oscillospiraceae bacterium]|nr:response regulator [Oscillospiraceae bacterium]
MDIRKEKLNLIENLDYCGRITAMDDSDFRNYCDKLEKFVESFPILEEKLKANFTKNNFGGIGEALSDLKYMISDIRAGNLLKLCETLLADIGNPDKEQAEAALTHFLTTASMLSIEIQMSCHADTGEHKEVSSAPKKEGPRTILAVDDVSLLLATIRTFIQSDEYKFVGVTSGEAALKYVQSHEADLFLLDIEMPNMNGYELAAKLKAEGQTAPIIFLTGNAQSEYVMKAIQMGAADFIVKPASKDQVLDKIKKYIR